MCSHGEQEARIRQGDTDALAEYIEARRPQLLAYIERNLSDAMRRKVEPDDLVQEVSIECVRSLSEIDLADREVYGWLCQVAKRRIIDAYRKHFGAQKRSADREVALQSPGDNSSQPGLVDMLVISMTSPSAAYSRDQREFKLLGAIEELPDEARLALQMRYIEGLPSKEIATQLGKSDGAVRVLLTRTLKRLQQMLGPDAAPR